MNVKEIKDEIKEEETFLLKLFQLEKLIRKYKNLLIGFGILIVVGFFGYQINSYLQTQKLIKTNTAYNELLKNPDNKKALAILRENQKLFKLYLLQTSNDDVTKLEKVAQGQGIVANIAKYQIAVIKGNIKDINNYAMSIGDIYKNLALLNLERLYLKDNNHKKAQEIVSQMNDDEILQLAKGLLHYGIVK